MKSSRSTNILLLTFAFLCLMIVSKARACEVIPLDQVDIARTYLRIIVNEYPDGMVMPEAIRTIQTKAKGFATLRVMDQKHPGLLQGKLIACADDQGYEEIQFLYNKLESNFDFYHQDVADFLKNNAAPMVD